jgi:hypothetical protein
MTQGSGVLVSNLLQENQRRRWTKSFSAVENESKVMGTVESGLNGIRNLTGRLNHSRFVPTSAGCSSTVGSISLLRKFNFAMRSTSLAQTRKFSH